ncbi:MAG: hypothetical protein OEL53_18505 [Rhodospirillales bacterium]|nr:hypothetical protein [Rhodospirillales bacterium]
MSDPNCNCPFERKEPPGIKRLLATLAVLALFLALLMWLGR